MYKNEEDKMNAFTLIAMQALYGIQNKYEEFEDKSELGRDLDTLIEFCEYHKLFKHESRLKILVGMIIEKENLIPWLKERLTNE